MSDTLTVRGVERRIFWLDPRPEASREPSPAALPLLLLLHGSMQSGRALVEAWAEVAVREGVVLLAPEARDIRAWHLREDSPTVLHEIVDSVAARRPVDRRRLYLFGHSGGAVYALTLAMLQSEYFAAAAVHAGAWREAREFRALSYAKRRMPIALVVGGRDPFFPRRAVRATERALREAGHPVAVTIVPRHGHAYREVSERINPELWTFLSAVALD